MSTRLTTLIVVLLILGAILAGVLLWDQLPDQMASHWDVNDQVNGYMPKFWGVFMMPLVTLGMFVLFLVVPNIDLSRRISRNFETLSICSLHSLLGS